ncbi:MAG: MBL fold metallo-hydrolase [Parcubacteria group bacterium]|nr:MBL fold metallo-hydrolase [Parcubacteria group bacterium]
MKLETKIFLKAASIIFTILIVVWFLVLSGEDGKELEIISFDIGQGDAILIKTPENQTMLIDGGPNNKVLQKLGQYLPALAKRVDIVLLTHPHADHVTGLVEVLKRYDVGAVILTGADLKTDVYSEFLKIVEEKNIPVVIAEAGEAIHFSDNLEFDVLSPEQAGDLVFNKKSEGFGSGGNDVNDTSVVGKLMFNNFSILLTGDATSKIENRLLIYGENLKSDILKAGHHGSKYSSSLSFLKFVSPKAVIIEVGAKNRYGHPSPAALSRLKMVDSETFRTDLDGDIKISTDGFTTNIYKEK